MLSIQDDVDTLERMVLSGKKESIARTLRISRNSECLGFQNIAEKAASIGREIEQDLDTNSLTTSVTELGVILNRELKPFLPSD